MVARGEIWWGETPEARGRPYLVVSRDPANAVMRKVLVAPITRTVRNAPSELAVGPAEGLPAESVAFFDDLQAFGKSYLVRKLGSLGPRTYEICQVAAATLDC